MTENSNEVIVAADEVDARIIEPSQFVADTEAFIDVRLPRSQGKASYSFIGPGVSQNGRQTINLTIPHGFNVGAATVPAGKVNNPHLHYTAEVFICTAGKWRILIGEHGEQTIDIAEGTVFSAPTFVFRGFENIGDDDGWLFAVLGGDETGGIVWAPHILAEAAETGLYLGRNYEVLDALAGDDTTDVVSPMASSELVTESYSDEEIASRAVRLDAVDWSERALLSSVLPGHESRMAPMIGYGMSQNRRHVAPIGNPHGFSLEWLELPPGASTGRHRIDHSQA